MNKQRLQVSSLCGTPFLTYLLKHSPQIYRAQYTDAIVVSFPGTLTRQLEINDNIWNSLLLWERLLFPCELVYIHLNTSPCTWTVQTAKDHKKRPFFKRGSFVTVPSWCRIHYLPGGNFENSRCCILNKKDDTELETCENILYILGVPTPGDDKK